MRKYINKMLESLFAKLHEEKGIWLLIMVLVAVTAIMTFIATNYVLPTAAQTEIAKVNIFLAYSGVVVILFAGIAAYIKRGNKAITGNFIAGTLFFAVAFWFVLETLVQVQEVFAGSYTFLALLLAFFGYKLLERSAKEAKNTE